MANENCVRDGIRVDSLSAPLQFDRKLRSTCRTYSQGVTFVSPAGDKVQLAAGHVGSTVAPSERRIESVINDLVFAAIAVVVLDPETAEARVHGDRGERVCRGLDAESCVTICDYCSEMLGLDA
ncbi:hypothetical protein C6A85_000000100795 [Mycobacterium sp. ITM-2017-0098]|nr:hypothetical protein C6A85_000000100795 [Mycobacterium sp. ITM-2017-0098]